MPERRKLKKLTQDDDLWVDGADRCYRYGAYIVFSYFINGRYRGTTTKRWGITPVELPHESVQEYFDGLVRFPEFCGRRVDCVRFIDAGRGREIK